MGNEKIKQKLNEFHVDVPDFPMKKSKVDRLANWLFDPVPLPIPDYSFTKKGTALITSFPILITILSALPILFF